MPFDNLFSLMGGTATAASLFALVAFFGVVPALALLAPPKRFARMTRLS